MTADEMLPPGSFAATIKLIIANPIDHTKAVGFAAIYDDMRFSEEVRKLAKEQLDKIINRYIDLSLGRNPDVPRYKMVKGARVRIK